MSQKKKRLVPCSLIAARYRVVQKLQTVIFQNFCRPQGPTKTANCDFSKFSPPAGYKNSKQWFPILFYARGGLHNLQTVILQNFRRPQGPTKTANSDFSKCFAARRALQKRPTVIKNKTILSFLFWDHVGNSHLGGLQSPGSLRFFWKQIHFAKTSLRFLF